MAIVANTEASVIWLSTLSEISESCILTAVSAPGNYSTIQHFFRGNGSTVIICLGPELSTKAQTSGTVQRDTGARQSRTADERSASLSLAEDGGYWLQFLFYCRGVDIDWERVWRHVCYQPSYTCMWWGTGLWRMCFTACVCMHVHLYTCKQHRSLKMHTCQNSRNAT